MAKPASNPIVDKGQLLAETLGQIRAKRIRAARARVPMPTYQQIAIEVGCSEKTVYNIVNEITHAGD